MTLFRHGALALVALGLSQIGPSALGALADAAGMHAVAADLGSYGAAEAAFIRGGAIKVKTDSYRVIVIVGEDTAENQVEAVRVTIKPDGDSPAPLEPQLTLPLRAVKENGNKQFAYNLLDFAGPAVNRRYSMTMTMLDVKGAPVGETKTMTVEVEDDGDARVRAVAIRQLNEQDFQLRVVVVGDQEAAVQAVQVKFSDDFEGPAPESFALTLPLVRGEEGRRIYAVRDLHFEVPQKAEDNAYNLVVDLIDGQGKSLGAAEFTAVVDGGTYGEIVDLTQDLGACQSKTGPLTDFAFTSIDAADQGLELSAALQGLVDGLPDDAVTPELKGVPESFNVLLHELRGLALEVTLE